MAAITRPFVQSRPKSALLPRAHGSGLFTRGETQVLTIATLGMPSESQRIDTLSSDDEKRFMHHYNFPPYSVGEARSSRGPGRREIGHGALAERALAEVIPDSSEFPYTIRLVSEVMSSNGSTSMASVCGSTLALMDAGVPIKAPVAGVAMGLITEGDSVRDPDRHHRHGRFSRRYGFQGRRHGRRHYGAAARSEIAGRSARAVAQGDDASARCAPFHPGKDAGRDARTTRRHFADTRRASR